MTYLTPEKWDPIWDPDRDWGESPLTFDLNSASWVSVFAPNVVETMPDVTIRSVVVPGGRPKFVGTNLGNPVYALWVTFISGTRGERLEELKKAFGDFRSPGKLIAYDSASSARYVIAQPRSVFVHAQIANTMIVILDVTQYPWLAESPTWSSCVMTTGSPYVVGQAVRLSF